MNNDLKSGCGCLLVFVGVGILLFFPVELIEKLIDKL